jgi:hypothetical protein
VACRSGIESVSWLGLTWVKISSKKKDVARASSVAKACAANIFLLIKEFDDKKKRKYETIRGEGTKDKQTYRGSFIDE